MKSGGISKLKKSNNNSPMWSDLLKVKHIYLRGRIMLAGNGKTQASSMISGVGRCPLKTSFQGYMRSMKSNLA